MNEIIIVGVSPLLNSFFMSGFNPDGMDGDFFTLKIEGFEVGHLPDAGFVEGEGAV